MLGVIAIRVLFRVRMIICEGGILAFRRGRVEVPRKRRHKSHDRFN
jgi:hypothetical protein